MNIIAPILGLGSRSMPLPYFVGSFLSFSDDLSAEFFVFFFDRDDFRLGSFAAAVDSSDEEEENPSPSFFAAVGNILLRKEDLERFR